MYGGTAILSSVERAGELIFESLQFGVFQLRANEACNTKTGFRMSVLQWKKRTLPRAAKAHVLEQLDAVLPAVAPQGVKA
jgi:hypothetical protein